MNEKTALNQQVKEKIKNPLLHAVNCIYIPVADYEKSADWYGEYLGLNRVSPGSNIVLLGNGTWMFLCDAAGESPNFVATDGTVISPFTFETEDIVTLHQSLTRGGAEVEPVEDFGDCGLKFWFKDPDGNRFHVWQDPFKAANR